jgi:hypothetical protein
VAGRKQLVHETNRWRQMARAIALVMGEPVEGQVEPMKEVER